MGDTKLKVAVFLYVIIFSLGCEEEKWPYRDAIKAAMQMGAKVENRVSNIKNLWYKNVSLHLQQHILDQIKDWTFCVLLIFSTD